MILGLDITRRVSGSRLNESVLRGFIYIKSSGSQPLDRLLRSLYILHI